MNAKSANERQQKRRNDLKAQNMKAMYVRGTNGEYDERIRVALAVKKLADEGRLSEDVLNLIIEEAVNVIEPIDRVNRLYIQKMMARYLKEKA
ncbi:hypothetical protein [Vibrio parahaemolyticus]|uniref:hypothetical protein n=5 Tax=Vibrio parahaemolyticus TaxID=670 RepID=UPI0011216319|nr:hypothetical protein [Vibrio parahaemolyticus]MCR9857268.1 hypothetical protein [Vibrio parahaemolyticus]TOM96534.1 hypothetical protein CGH66_14365 [Vibrio parahaemolyticus]TON44669.1 hypothetical protein CGH56_25495 [Vibrio parahaemolyticus]TOO12586.1 hypothetical protein CGH43_15095 [Vibrio parahaemolyticus]TOO76736.1 hypothetical protein CGH30_25295 [Vibrio parahaemolyticus]